ncbi:hypothetical protein ABW19_dt0209331 [Dactylella cylindrospora]|nr:hypothetical protein ABW19_dt0209331 [Dactylella cylindrospora]
MDATQLPLPPPASTSNSHSSSIKPPLSSNPNEAKQPPLNPRPPLTFNKHHSPQISIKLRRKTAEQLVEHVAIAFLIAIESSTNTVVKPIPRAAILRTFDEAAKIAATKEEEEEEVFSLPWFHTATEVLEKNVNKKGGALYNWIENTKSGVGWRLKGDYLDSKTQFLWSYLAHNKYFEDAIGELDKLGKGLEGRRLTGLWRLLSLLVKTGLVVVPESMVIPFGSFYLEGFGFRQGNDVGVLSFTLDPKYFATLKHVWALDAKVAERSGESHRAGQQFYFRTIQLERNTKVE